MSEKYKFWDVEQSEKNCIFTLLVDDDIEDKIIQACNKMKELETEISDYKKRMKEADDDDIQPLRFKQSTCESEYRQIKAQISKYEDKLKIYRHNKDIRLRCERMKDKYSRKECLSVVIVTATGDDGKIVSSSTRISNDIYKLEEFGIYLTEPYYDELSKIIRDIYFDLSAIEQEFIDNDVPRNAVEAFVEMLNEELNVTEKIKNPNTPKSGEEIVRTNREKYKSKDDSYYDIPVKDFKQLYDNSNFKRFTLTSIKEALIIHGYAKANRGRNDYNVANVGKVIRLYVSEMEKIGTGDNNENTEE